MCGIAGILDLAGTARDPRERELDLGRMIDRISHRGPDDAGILIDQHVALGAVRLRIVDLTQGAQPMGDESERWWIVYNGEVHNFVELREELAARGRQFKSTSDTEVVLQAWIEWGLDSPRRFEGGFAFAIFDRLARTAHLVRDRFGKRPLFYRRIGRAFVFASEMKSFLACADAPFAWDGEVLAGLFGQWTLLDGETPFQGIRQVRAGSVLTITPDGLRETRYGGFASAVPTSPLEFDEAAERLAQLLDGAVCRRLRSDVDVGVMLSGGLDSAVITCLARRMRPGRLRSFSLGFAEPEFDETRDQDTLVTHFGLDHSRHVIGQDDVANAFEAAVFHAEVPQFRTALAPMYVLFHLIKSQGIKVVLSGEGADEIFLGYDIFRETRLRADWSSLSGEQRRAGLRGLYPYLAHFSEANERAMEAVFARSTHGTDELLFSHALRFDNGRFAQRLLAVTPGDRCGLADAAAAAGLASRPPVARAQWLEFHTLLQGYLLSSQGDRMSFAHGVEPRNPFLAPDVVSFAGDLPETYHLSVEGREKSLLKRAFRTHLPASIVSKPKMPYRAPGAAVFRDVPGRLRPWVEDILAPGELTQLGPVDASMAERLVDRVRAESRPISPREDQAFVLILSLAVLDRLFVRGGARSMSVAQRHYNVRSLVPQAGRGAYGS